MTTRKNFELTSDYKIKCNQFYEGNTSITSSSSLPFYSSSDYYACADDLTEYGATADNIIYDTNGKALSCNQIIEGDESDYAAPSYFEQHYVMGSATSYTDLCQKFDPVLQVSGSNGIASNFENWKTEVNRLTGSSSGCMVLVVEKQPMKTQHNRNRHVAVYANEEHLQNVNGEAVSGNCYVVRVDSTIAGCCELSANYCRNSSLYASAREFSTYSSETLTDLVAIIKSRVHYYKLVGIRNHYYYGIVFVDTASANSIKDTFGYDHYMDCVYQSGEKGAYVLSRMSGNFIDASYNISGLVDNCSLRSMVNPIF